MSEAAEGGKTKLKADKLIYASHTFPTAADRDEVVQTTSEKVHSVIPDVEYGQPLGVATALQRTPLATGFLVRLLATAHSKFLKVTFQKEKS